MDTSLQKKLRDTLPVELVRFHPHRDQNLQFDRSNPSPITTTDDDMPLPAAIQNSDDNSTIKPSPFPSSVDSSALSTDQNLGVPEVYPALAIRRASRSIRHQDYPSPQRMITTASLLPPTIVDDDNTAGPSPSLAMLSPPTLTPAKTPTPALSKRYGSVLTSSGRSSQKSQPLQPP
jgi:hypothetical protein